MDLRDRDSFLLALTDKQSALLASRAALITDDYQRYSFLLHFENKLRVVHKINPSDELFNRCIADALEEVA